jgi:hypothetical protein
METVHDVKKAMGIGCPVASNVQFEPRMELLREFDNLRSRAVKECLMKERG